MIIKAKETIRVALDGLGYECGTNTICGQVTTCNNLCTGGEICVDGACINQSSWNCITTTVTNPLTSTTTLTDIWPRNDNTAYITGSSGTVMKYDITGSSISSADYND